ncbi:YokU family protein [Metabacillus litoralis]|uniref:YokU family protein n=1 Tax=Metabacillus litoralis TaxID=152268 RepID=UPI001CFF12BA|nr:YokU family protein [Metabacillus litoralis]
MECEWCGESNLTEMTNTVYWELPDGTRAIEIKETPAKSCLVCGMQYQTEEMIEELEDQLYLIDTSKIDKVISYESLMSQPRLLKRNYFKF